MKRYILICCFLCLQGLFAQVQFEAKVSKSTLGINERFRIDFTMNEDGDNFVPPDFDGFMIAGGPSQNISYSFVNGKRSFVKSYSYILMPKQRGTLTIQQASIEINGQVYKTSPVKINVTAAVAQQRDPNDPQVASKDAIHLVAEVSKKNPYVNEPITVVYKLYISYNIGVSSWRELDKPKYNDFWSHQIDIKKLVAEEGTYNGEKMREVVLRKTVLYPQKSGRLQIEPLVLDVDVQLPNGRRTFFGQPVIVEDNVRVAAGSNTINVKPLPETGRPLDFSGAVGSFDFNVKPSKTVLKNGESLDLTVSVSGKGNLKLFNLPKPVVPASLEVYDPVHNENVTTPLSGMTGSVSDKYTIIPQYKGDYPVKPMTFSYFDPSAQRYRTISSPEIVIKVLDGPVAAATATERGETAVAKQPIQAGTHFQFIKLRTALEPMEKKDFFGSTLFYTLLAIPFFCIPLLILLRKKKESVDADIVGNKTKLSNRLAKKYLAEAKKHMADKERFYITLERALHNFLKAKLTIETSEMSKDKIRELLLSRGAEPESVSDFINLTESCEFARYAPASTGAILNDYEKAVAIISSLEKQLK